VLVEEEIDDRNTLKSVSTIVREHMRILNTQRDSDRLYLERNMQSMILLSTFTNPFLDSTNYLSDIKRPCRLASTKMQLPVPMQQ
jgi:hypothetical protein